ncbi:hypothetical protein ACFQ9X_28910 [Catenulispora yoronensis]
MRVGERDAQQIMKQPEAARLLLRVFPVCSMVGAAAATLDETDFGDLEELSKAPVRVLLKSLITVEKFGGAELPVSSERRLALGHRFRPYGIHLACGLIRDGVDSVEQLRTELDARSGLPELRSLLVNHFGRRRDLLKVTRVVTRVSALNTDDLSADARERFAVDSALRRVADLVRDDQDLAEYEVLTRLYDGRLVVPEDLAQEFRRAAGEHGASVADRLNLTPSTPLAVLEATALDRLAASRDSLLVLDPHAVSVLRAIERRYELIVHRVRTARALLEDGI